MPASVADKPTDKPLNVANVPSHAVTKLVSKQLCLILATVGLGVLFAGLSVARAQPSGTAAATNSPSEYNRLVTAGRKALAAGKGEDALVSAVAGIEKEPKRFEAYALTALIYQAKGDLPEARKYMDLALQRAPESKQSQLREIAKTLDPPFQATSQRDLSAETRRKLDAITQIVADADKAASPNERQSLLKELLEKSEPFVRENPNFPSVWLWRAEAAVELNLAHEGWDAGQHLKALPTGNSEEQKVRALMAKLERRGWLGDKDPEVVQKEQAENQQARTKQAAEAFRQTKQEVIERVSKVRQETVAQVVTSKLGKWQISTTGVKSSGFIVLSRDPDGRLLCKGNLEYKCKGAEETFKAIVYSVGPPTTPDESWHYFLDTINETRSPLNEEPFFTSQVKKAPVSAEVQGDFTDKVQGVIHTATRAELMLRLDDEQDMLSLHFPDKGMDVHLAFKRAP